MIKTIVVPTDGSDHANKAIDLGADIAGKYGARIVILHVLMHHMSATDVKILSREIGAPASVIAKLEELEQSMLDATMASATGGAPIMLPVPSDILSEVGKLITDKAVEAAKAKGASDVAVQIVDGSAAEAILAAAETEHADMIVMGSRGLGKFADLFMGGVSHKVSHLSSCTCVTVK